jgi:hypothetical protein
MTNEHPRCEPPKRPRITKLSTYGKTLAIARRSSLSPYALKPDAAGRRSDSLGGEDWQTITGHQPEIEPKKHRSWELDTDFRRTNLEESGFQTPHTGRGRSFHIRAFAGFTQKPPWTYFHDGMSPPRSSSGIFHSFLAGVLCSPALIRRFVGTHSPPPETYRPIDPARGRGCPLGVNAFQTPFRGLKATSSSNETNKLVGFDGGRIPVICILHRMHRMHRMQDIRQRFKVWKIRNAHHVQLGGRLNSRPRVS